MTRLERVIEKKPSRFSPAQAPWLALAPTLLVVGGVGLCLVSLLRDYFAAGFSPSFGVQQWAAIIAGCASMAAGAVLQVVAQPETRAETLRFWMVAGQVALLLAAFRIYEIESAAFFELVFTLIAAGFIVHHHLSPALRRPFFFFLGLACFVGVFVGRDPTPGLWLVGLALAVIALASLPIALWIRVVLLLAVGAGFAILRVGIIETDWGGMVVPLLASMLIFRVVIYLYDVENRKGPTNIWQRLSYFFLPPNIVFPFFPVVDFATFGRSYYNDDASRIYQRGVHWMVRGLAHLILYRVIYLYATMQPSDVEGLGDFFRHIVTNFALYLRISGSFHLIIGMLVLFGYNLPETHTRFYFSNSFIDFWRRINIYWKDFMQKLFFNPSFTRLKRVGASHEMSLLGGIAVVFFATWALHAYYWFWLRGSVHLTMPDVLFWTILAAALAVQTLRENRASAARRPARSYPLGPRAFLVLRTVCTMFIICLLWSMWTSPTMLDWFRLLSDGGVTPAFATPSAATFSDWIMTLAWIGVISFAAAIAMGVTFGLGAPQGQPARKLVPSRTVQFSAAVRAAGLGAAAIVAMVVVHALPVQQIVGARAALIVEDIRVPRLSDRDRAQLEQGYYENMTDVNAMNSRLWEVYVARPRQIRALEDMEFVRLRNDQLRYEFVPGDSGVRNGVTYEINSWGMRDGEVSLEKPPGELRIGLIGPSHVSGHGVEIDERFDAPLLDLLNAGRTDDEIRYDILNFAVDGHRLSEQLFVFTDKASRFDLDVVLFITNIYDLNRHAHLATMHVRGDLAAMPYGAALAEAAGLTPGMSFEEAEARIGDVREEEARLAYSHMAAEVRSRGITPIWVYLPLAGESPKHPDIALLRRLAEEQGFVMIDLSHIFDGIDEDLIWLKPWDSHHSPYAHQIIARALDRALRDLDRSGAINIGLHE